jgi:hypothetical protein
VYPASSSKGIHPKKKREGPGGTVTLAAGACKGKATRGGGGTGRLPKQGMRGARREKAPAPCEPAAESIMPALGPPESTDCMGPPSNDLWIRHHCSRRPRKTGVIRGCRSSHLPNIKVKMLFVCAHASVGKKTLRSAHTVLRQRPGRREAAMHANSEANVVVRHRRASSNVIILITNRARCHAKSTVPEVGPARRSVSARVPKRCPKSGLPAQACPRLGQDAECLVLRPRGPDALPVGVVHRRAKRCIPRSGEGRAQSTRSIVLGPRQS